MTKIVAHRGAARGNRTIENYLPTYETAYRMVHAAECDIQLTHDQQIVLWHDDCLNGEAQAKGIGEKISDSQLRQRLTQTIQDFTLTELNTFLPISKLSDVLKVIPSGAELLIEVKKPDTNILPILFSELAQHTTPQKVILISFHQPVIRQIKHFAPQYRALWLVTQKTTLNEMKQVLQETAADGIGLEYDPKQEATFIHTAKNLLLQNALIQVWNMLMPEGDEKRLFQLCQSLKIQYCNTDYV